MEKTHPSPHFHPHYAALARPWSFRRKSESREEGWHQPHPNTSNDQVSFSYLGVPAAGMSDCYEHGRPPAHAEWAPPSPSMGECWGEGEARSVEACPQPMARRPTVFIFLLWPPQRYSASCRPFRDYCEKRRSNQPRRRLPTSSFPRKRESKGGAAGANDTRTLPPTSVPNFIPWCAGGSRHGRLLSNLDRWLRNPTAISIPPARSGPRCG